MTDILVFLFTYDRYELLKESLRTMFNNPGMDFRLWVLDNGSEFSDLYGDKSGHKQFELLADYYKSGKIEFLMLNNRNVGCNHAVNQLMAEAKLTSIDPKITRPEFVLSTNDDMFYEDGWLKSCYDTYMALEEKERVKIVSPFHCKFLNGKYADWMHTVKTVNVDGINYEIKDYASGNTWFMRGTTWMDLFDWYIINSPTEGADWQKLEVLHKNNYRCAVTPKEMAHHAPESQGTGKYNRLGHW
jgi:hypothetical protein